MARRPELADALPERPFPIELFRRLRFAGGLFCPRCDGTRIQRWGRFGWRRRYRCGDCERTFSDFTGTPLAYLKRVDRWPQFCRSFPGGATVRAVARLLAIHKDTSFRWRRRLLAGLRGTERRGLAGRISVGQTWFPFSEKGSRRLDRPPRRVAYEGLSIGTTPEWVVLACDDGGRSIEASVGRLRPSKDHLATVLGEAIAEGSVVRSREGRFGAAAMFAARAGLGWERELLTAPVESPGPEPAAGLAVRLKRWLARFHGVATRYLDEYLVWFRLVDLAEGRTLPHRPVDPVLTGAFP